MTFRRVIRLCDRQTVKELQFSPNGQLLAGLSEDGVVFWEVDGAKVLATKCHLQPTAILWHPDEPLILFIGSKYGKVDIVFMNSSGFPLYQVSPFMTAQLLVTTACRLSRNC